MRLATTTDGRLKRLSFYLSSVTGTRASYNILLFVVLVSLSATPFTASVAQMSSTNYKLATHTFVGGGGASSDLSNSVIGTITTTGSSLTAADNWAAYNGFIGTSLGHGGRLLAFYTTKVEDTVVFESKQLTISYGGNDSEISGIFYHRAGGREQYEAINLTPIAGDSLTVNVSADLLSIRGFEFYFKINRGTQSIRLAHPDSPYVWVTRFTNEQGQYPSTTRAGSYRMISLPMNIDGSNEVVAIFEDDLGPADPSLWRLGSYANNLDSVIEYPQAAPAIPEQGYWLITKEPTTFGAAGLSVRPSVKINSIWYYPVPVNRGWNQIANPFPFDIKWYDVLFEHDGNLLGHDSTSNIFWYAGAGYSTPKIMQAWQGFYYFTWENNLKLFFPYQSFGIESQKPTYYPVATDNYNWSIKLQLFINDLASEQSLLAVHPEAMAGYDKFDRPMPPPPPGYPSLGSQLIGDNDFLWATNVQNVIDTTSYWPIVFSSGLDRTLSIEGLADLPIVFQAMLILDIGSIIKLKNDTIIALPNDSHQADLIIGRPKNIESLAQEALPDNYYLAQNFPNPFNPETTIRFSLPETEFVKLRIYNMLGQEVAQVVDRQLPAGVHTFYWKGRGSSGRRVASGIYLYRLTTENFSDSKKMLLLK